MDDLDDHLAGVDVLDDVGADGALLDALHEVLDDLVVDVGLEQRQADLAHGHVDVVFADAAAPGQAGQGGLESVGEGVEHGLSLAAGAEVAAGASPDRLGRWLALDGEEGGHEGVGVEVAQIGHLLAEPDEEHGHVHAALDGEGHAALGGAIELGQGDGRQARRTR